LPQSLLEDHFADEAVRNIDYDFSRLKVDDNLGIGLAIRAKTLDVCVQDFLARNPDAIVLHLACGLDTRIFRVDRKAWTGSMSTTRKSSSSGAGSTHPGTITT
jgi:O-methyltransferase involved in polyketide biosynthesis